MKLTPSFLRVRMDVPLHVHALAFGYDGVGIGGRRRLTGRADNHAGAVNVEADGLAALQLVPQGDPHAIALVSTDDEGLDVIALDAVGHSTRIILVLLVL